MRFVSISLDGWSIEVCFVIAFFLILYVPVIYYSPEGLRTSIAISLSAVAAVIIFIATENIKRYREKKQHTINLLMQTRLCDTGYQSQHKAFEKYFPDKIIDLDDWNSKKELKKPEEDVAALDSLTYLLNYYEFLAVGIYSGDLENKMLYKTVRGLLCNLIESARHIILDVRTSKNGEDSSLAEKKLEHLVSLYYEWRDNDIEIDLGPKPLKGNLLNRLE